MEAPAENTTEKTTADTQAQNGGEDNSKAVEPEKQIPEEISKAKDSDKKPMKKTKEEKKNKEEEKRIKLLLRTFEGIEDVDAKLYAIAKKYVQLAADNKSLQYKKDDFESRNEKLTKERDNLQSDYNKATLAKSKLESLCRELQRHSKLVKEECQLRAQEEEAKRKELSDRFQTTINDISQQMQDNFKRNEQLKTENEELAVKLKGLISQYETREQHVDKVVQHKQLELQLAEAKMAQQSLQFNEMKEKSLIEKQELLKDSMDYRKRYELMVQQEKELKTQLSLYTERFDEIQSTLNKSNEVFATFKSEMDKMSKTIKKLEKENKTLKSRSENTNRSLLAMLDERANMEKQIQVLTAKNSKLENLCRAMQKGVLPQSKGNIEEETKPAVTTVDKNSSHCSQDPPNNEDEEPNNDQAQTGERVAESHGEQEPPEDTENGEKSEDDKEKDEEAESDLKNAGEAENGDENGCGKSEEKGETKEVCEPQNES